MLTKDFVIKRFNVQNYAFLRLVPIKANDSRRLHYFLLHDNFSVCGTESMLFVTCHWDQFFFFSINLFRRNISVYRVSLKTLVLVFSGFLFYIFEPLLYAFILRPLEDRGVANFCVNFSDRSILSPVLVVSR